MAEPISLPKVVEPPRGERLKNKVVLLTGAAQGIGEAIVASFVSQQAKMVISDIQAEKVEKVAAHWRAQGADVQAITADVSCQSDLHAMVALAMELHGLAAIPGTVKINGETAPPILFGHFQRIAEHIDPGAIDQHIHAAM